MSFLFVEGPAGRGAECAHTRTTDAATDPLQKTFLPLRSRASPPRGLGAVEGLDREEALLTGENDPVPTHAGDAVLSGSAVVAGTGVVLAIVVAVRLNR